MNQPSREASPADRGSPTIAGPSAAAVFFPESQLLARPWGHPFDGRPCFPRQAISTIDCCAANATPGSVSGTFDASEVRLLRQSAYRSFVPRPAAHQRARNGHTLMRVLTMGSGTTVHATPLTPCAQRHETQAWGPRSGGPMSRWSHDTLRPRVALGAQESIAA